MLGHNNPPTEKEILEQRLSSYEEVRKDIDGLKSFNIPFEVSDEKESGRLTDYIKSIKSVYKKVSDIHKKEKAIYLECGRIVDGWKNAFESDLKKLTDSASLPLLAFQEKKEREERARRMEKEKAERELAERLAFEAAVYEENGINDTAQELMGAAIEAEKKADFVAARVDDVKIHTRGEMGSVSSTSKIWTGSIESVAALDLEKLRGYIPLDALERAVKAYAKATDGQQLQGAKIFQQSKLNIR